MERIRLKPCLIGSINKKNLKETIDPLHDYNPTSDFSVFYEVTKDDKILTFLPK